MSARRALAADSPRRIRTIRGGPVALRLNVRVLACILIAFIAVLALAAWAMTLGSFAIPISGVVRSVLGSGTDEHDFIIRTLRAPRVLTAMLVGALLAMSGAIFQGVVRNPLVSPDIIGINAGASLVAVFWIVTFQPIQLLPLAAFLGATGTAALIYLLTWQGGIAGSRMILVGIGMNATLAALTTFLLVRFPIEQVSRAYLWTTGSVYASSWSDVRILAIVTPLLVLMGAAMMWALRVLQLGDQTARSLGQAVERTRLGLIATGCACSAFAIALTGPIGFVAFMIPHIARMIAGPMTGGVFVFTALLGAGYLLGADMIAQHALPVTLPAGAITAALGAPYFLFLLWRTSARL